MKLALSAGAVALSMALAGCGGSSSGGGPDSPDPDGDPPKCNAPQVLNADGVCVDPPPQPKAGAANAKALMAAIG